MNETNQFMMDPGPEVYAVPSMMSKAEREFLYGYAAGGYQGDGIIIDAGIFLGGSTMCFGCGLEKNPRRDEILNRWPRPIRSYDRAIAGPQVARHMGQSGRKLPLEGESFAQIIEENIAPVAQLVDLRIGNILEQPVEFEPIEILFLDVLKNPDIAAFVVDRFLGRLIPGRSIVIQQDYFFEMLPYIKTMQEYFSDHFTFLGEIESSAIFRCERAITREDIEAFLTRQPDGDEEMAWSTQAMERTSDPMRKIMMAVSRLRIIMHYRGQEAATAALRDIEVMAAQLDQKELSKGGTKRSLDTARKIVAGTALTGVGTPKPQSVVKTGMTTASP